MYIPLNIKSHYTVLSSVITPKELKGKEEFVICDNNSVSGAVQFKTQFPKAGLGISVNILNKGSISIIARNYAGWKKLIRISSLVNSKDYVNSEIPYDIIKDMYCDDLMFIYSYWENDTVKNHWFGIDLTEENEFLREVCGDRCVAFHTNIMAHSEQIVDLKAIYCIKHNISSEACIEKYSKIFSGKCPYHILSYEEMVSVGYSEQELTNSVEIYNSIEKYCVTQNATLPKFPCGDKTSDQYLLELCQDGFNKYVKNRGYDEKLYLDRMNYEFKVITGFKLSDYFLIVRDIIKFVEEQFYLTSIRGSAAGCLVSYLIELSKINPIIYNLIFERFMNPGRGASMPDVDIDVPADNREEVLNYIRDKYGKDRVGQISTYQTIKASSAIKGVFRANPVISLAEVNTITKRIPEQSKVADRLKDMPEDERSLIRFAILEHPDHFSQWCHIEDDEIKGDYKVLFEQAIRLEGLKSNKSKHAAGVIIAPEPLENICPTRYDSEEGLIVCDMEMADLEALGCLKVDILGLRLFSRMIDISNDLKMEYVF